MKKLLNFFVILLPIILNGAIVAWDGEANNKWNGPLNWDGNVVPLELL